MQLADFVNLLKTVDSSITKNKGNGQENYSTWSIGAPAERYMSDDQAEDTVQRVYVDRYTKDAEDQMPGQLCAMLDENFISFEQVYIYEEDTQYHHHSFTCYVGQPEESED